MKKTSKILMTKSRQWEGEGMVVEVCPVVAVEHIQSDIYVLTFRSKAIASIVQPGQFVNIKVNDLYLPLLRRPFSVYKVNGDLVKIIFNIVGTGTRILSLKHEGENIDVLGPLGRSFHLHENYETALLVAGGLGVAPLPMITDAVAKHKHIVTFLGARIKEYIVDSYLQNVKISTDDGSKGFRGTVVELLRNELSKQQWIKPKIFACGPNRMLESLSKFASELNIPCEVSLESAMACGIGICQGCPVEQRDAEQKYVLICKEGPVFNSNNIMFE
jgi:dihydroorotate dehydrogenase electron transfer subunit